MPEMLSLCGKLFRVQRRVDKIAELMLGRCGVSRRGDLERTKV
jgi:hypothetical protein